MKNLDTSRMEFNSNFIDLVFSYSCENYQARLKKKKKKKKKNLKLGKYIYSDTAPLFSVTVCANSVC